MKKAISTLALVLLCFIGAQANPGDTTWVQANEVHLNYYNNFDTTVAFPDGSKIYRKIYLVFTLGQYNCPTSAQYCHQWDYTVSNYIMTKTGDTMEMCRFITPFATSGWTRFGSSWKQPYVFDVTDFYPLLKDSATVRIHYSGYSGGFTANIKFAFIEGTPDRNVTGITKLYDFSHSYGDDSNSINNYFPTIADTAPAGTESASLKYLVTGHGSDTNGCCEFASHFYEVNLNSTTIAHHDIWRDDCGLNELYPQGGTWIFDRGNWCPGATVRPIYDNLPNIIANTPFNINIQFENYSTTGSYGSYSSNAIIFYHGDFNKNLDASLEEIIAPTNNPNHYRANPSGNIPQILVHNSGRNTINKIDFEYGIQDSTVHNFTWQGSLAPLADTLINLPALTELTNMSINAVSSTQQFNVAISGVNGQADDDSTNNQLSSFFKVAPEWSGDLILTLKTGNLVSHGTSFGLGNPQQKWVITDMEDNVIAARDNTEHDTKYVDTIALPHRGFYKLTLTSGNGMGLHWWFIDNLSQQNQNIKQGYFTIAKRDGTMIPMKNYHYTGTSHDDWGSAYTQYFTIAEAGQFAGVANVNVENTVKVYPNPAHNFIRIDFAYQPQQDTHIELINILGQTIYQTTTHQKNLEINIKSFAPGIYTIRFTNSGSQFTKMQKVVIK